MKQKGRMTVKEATAKAFLNMNQEFHAPKLCETVRLLVGRPMLMDGTILRRLRELRNDEPVNFMYTVKDAEASLYQKSKIAC